MAERLQQTLNILSWNATGIMSSSTHLTNILAQRNIEICGISEHWLYEKDLMFFDKLDSNYKSHAVADTSLNFPGRRKVGKGGVAILWHKKHNQNIAPLDIDDDRIIGIKYNCWVNSAIYLFQMYLPCSNHTLTAFTEYVDKMRNILNLYSEKGIVVLMGDMNVNFLPNAIQCNPTGRKLRFLNFLRDTNLISLTTLEMCSGVSSSFVTYDNSTESLIDHILFPAEKLLYINECEICDDDCLNVSRHRPIFCQIRLPAYTQWSFGCEGDNTINWKVVSDEARLTYRQFISNDISIQNIINNGIISDTDINRAYSTIVTVVKKAAIESLPIKNFKRYLKPYWNAELNVLHKDMKSKRANWVRNGKPRGNISEIYTIYKAAKCDFRRKHRQIVDAYMKRQIEEIDRVAEIDSRLFLRLVNAKRKTSGPAVSSDINFDGRTASTPQEITDEWAKHFKKLYTPSDDLHFDNEHKNHISRQLQSINENLVFPDPPIISTEEVQAAVRLGKNGKAAGEDGITYEHIAGAGEIIFLLLAKLYTAMLKHSYAPDDIKRGVIITLFKGGNKRKDNLDNYRAITLSSVILKIFERILLTRIQLFDDLRPPIHPLQGGFQKKSRMFNDVILTERDS